MIPDTSRHRRRVEWLVQAIGLIEDAASGLSAPEFDRIHKHLRNHPDCEHIRMPYVCSRDLAMECDRSLCSGGAICYLDRPHPP